MAAATKSETLSTAEALDRIVAADILSPEQVPSFRKSTMDGYALRAADTFGASQSLPAFVAVIGEIKMGEVPQGVIGAGEALQIHTGGMLPDGADAVAMVETVQRVNEGEIEVLKAVAPGENVIQPGEDVAVGALILQLSSSHPPAGHRRFAGGRHRNDRCTDSGHGWVSSAVAMSWSRRRPRRHRAKYATSMPIR